MVEYNKIKEFFNSKDIFAKHLGIEVTELRAGYARTHMTIKPEHRNSLNIVHGGAIFSLADLAFAAASNSHGTAAVAINVNISYLKPIKSNELVAEAKENSCGTKLASYTIHIYDEEEVCAVFQGMAYRKKEELKFD